MSNSSPLPASPALAGSNASVQGMSPADVKTGPLALLDTGQESLLAPGPDVSE
jgi:hypothetical protein